jgi:4-hydroxy 2-oxovalerate aldolase
MKNIKILDCTLRDGGFLNDWQFGYNNILLIFQRLNNANIDIIEIGYLSDNCVFDYNRTMYPNTKSINKAFEKIKEKKSMVTAIIDYGNCNLNNIENKDNGFIDAIRVTFKKKEIENAIQFCKAIQEKGYKVFTQPVSITTYSDKEMLDLIEKINEIDPYTMSIVDTYGLLHKEKLIRYFYLMESNLKADISIGYHSHNNFQLAYSNSTELLNIKTNHNIIIDGSLYGMGKGAGNANIELLAMYLNDNFNKNYNESELLETIDINILKLKEKYSWGYSLPYFIAAFNDCHPEYVKFLQKRNTLSMKSINNILNKIDNNKKLSFDNDYIERLYFDYQKVVIDDTKVYDKLKDDLYGRNILLLGPGEAINNQREKILIYIEENHPIIISVNHISTIQLPDYLFISNAKRYEQFVNILINKNNSFKIIATSNINPINNEFEYIVNYENLLNQNTTIGDSSMIMLLNMLKKMDIPKICLAGFDGFSISAENYYDNYLDFFENNYDRQAFNEAVAEQVDQYRQKMEIVFITSSVYEEKYNK